MKSFFKILRYAGPYWVYAMLNVVFNILSVFFSLVQFGLFIPVLQMLFNNLPIPHSAPPMRLEIDALKDNFYFYCGRLLEMYGKEQLLV